MVYARGRFRSVLFKHRTMKHYIPKEDLRYYLRTTKKDIEFQQRILRYLCYGVPFCTLWVVFLINFLFYIFTGKAG